MTNHNGNLNARLERFKLIGFSLIGSGGNLHSVGGMLITTAMTEERVSSGTEETAKERMEETKATALAALQALQEVRKGIAQLELGLAPIAGVGVTSRKADS
jgi:hypothetical protein